MHMTNLSKSGPFTVMREEASIPDAKVIETINLYEAQAEAEITKH